MANEIAEKNLALKNLMLSLSEKSAWEYNSSLIEKSLSAMDEKLLHGKKEVVLSGMAPLSQRLCAPPRGRHI